MTKKNNDEDDDVRFDETTRAVDELLKRTMNNEKSLDKKKSMGRIKFADNIRNDPPVPGFMKVEFNKTDDGVDVVTTSNSGNSVDDKPLVEHTNGLYAIDLNTAADWWFNRSCTVFPLLLDQAKRTHIDIKDSFKPEKRLPDFNYSFLFILIIGVIGIVLGTKMFGLW